MLGSASPRRQALLTSLGVHFEVVPSGVEEPLFPAGSDTSAILETARAKAQDVGRKRPESVVIGADTAILLDGSVLGKPRDADDALDTLKRMTGRRHSVVTACCILDPFEGLERCFSVETSVAMARFGEEILRAYVDSGEPMDKAGSYAIQGVGSFLVRSIQGSYTNVVGLPLQEVVAELLEMKALTVASSRTGNGGEHEDA